VLVKAKNPAQPPLRRDFDVIDRHTGLGNRFADLAHGLEMSSQRFLEVPARFFRSVSDSRTSGTSGENAE
jgi:hypothetical protein